MAKKKKSSDDVADGANCRISSPQTMSSSTLDPDSSKKSSKPKLSMQQQQQPSSPALIICRNKHWRYISSFHGPWLQLPPEILETLANANYNAPRPRPIDPSVFFDLVKIRRLVDDATNLAVRAASGVASSALSGSGNSPHPAASLGLGFGPGGGGGGAHSPRLSRERKHRMREQATQKLSKAYHLDEIASSVATMQSTSTLEDVASLVLQRSRDHPDARYVHFFHEKIPSRQLAESTSLASLDSIIASRPTEGEPLRTRASVRIFKEDYDRAARDLTDALRVHRLYRSPHTAPKLHAQEVRGRVVQHPSHASARRHEEIALKEEDQPSSLEVQLLFQRAGVYLAMACQHVGSALADYSHPPETLNGRRKDDAAETLAIDNGTTGSVENDTTGLGGASGAEEEDEKKPAMPEEQRLARKNVKANAKRALRDYTAYLSHFEYSPDLPIEIVEDFARKVNQTANGSRLPRSHTAHTHSGRSDIAGHAVSGGRDPDKPYRLFPLSDLFAATPPPGLPPYPNAAQAPAAPSSPSPHHPPSQSRRSPPRREATTETLTYHPLLTDALHSLLLCHCLVQTSTKELLRHAHMVARLARLADGYPVFQASRSPARADWIEVLRRGDNWICLPGSWESLCAPAPLPLFQNPPATTPVHPATSLTTTRSSKPAPHNAVAAVPEATYVDKTAAEATSSRQFLAGDSNQEAGAVPRSQEDEKLRRQALPEALGADMQDRDADKAIAAAIDAALTLHDDDPAPSPSPSATRQPEAPLSSSASAASTTCLPSLPPPPPPTTTPATSFPPGPPPSNTAPRRWAVDDGREYPVVTERAGAVARWVREAPAHGGGEGGSGAGGGSGRKKKKKVGAARASAAALATLHLGSTAPQHSLAGEATGE